MIKVTAIQPFVHGAYNLAPGDEVDMPESVAADLGAVGLVSHGEKAEAAPLNKMQDAVINKAQTVPAKPAKPKK